MSRRTVESHSAKFQHHLMVGTLVHLVLPHPNGVHLGRLSRIMISLIWVASLCRAQASRADDADRAAHAGLQHDGALGVGRSVHHAVPIFRSGPTLAVTHR